MDNKPTLIEPGMRYFLGKTLKECKKFKNNYYSNIFNIITCIVIILAISLIFLYRYKGKLTKEEINSKNIKKKEYILSKLQQYAVHKKNMTNKNNLITDIPLWNNSNLY